MSEIVVIDGGKLNDRFPQPYIYVNESDAKFANGGAYPPDLSLITNIIYKFFCISFSH